MAGRTDAIPQIEIEPRTAASGARFENRFSVKSDVEGIEKVAIASLKESASKSLSNKVLGHQQSSTRDVHPHVPTGPISSDEGDHGNGLEGVEYWPHCSYMGYQKVAEDHSSPTNVAIETVEAHRGSFDSSLEEIRQKSLQNRLKGNAAHR